MKTITSHSLEETKKIAADWLTEISAQAEATVVGLSGHLGSGKTTFVQAVAKILGVDEQVTSPTFVIMKIYEIPVSKGNSWPWKRLVHIDAYRLERPEELEALGFEDIVANANNLVLIEWAENVGKALPANARVISFEATGETERRMTFS